MVIFSIPDLKGMIIIRGMVQQAEGISFLHKGNGKVDRRFLMSRLVPDKGAELSNGSETEEYQGGDRLLKLSQEGSDPGNDKC